MPCCSLGSILESMSGLSEAPMDVKYNTSFKISCSGEESSSPTVYHVEFDVCSKSLSDRH